MMETQARIALLIDADNSPASKIDVILAELAKVGVTNIRRAYGNWKKDELRGWEAVLHEYAIRPIQQFDYSKGKNATDMGMVIDAMDLLYTDRPEAFGIVSSDSDFTPLVMHLKAKGAQVFGFGAKKTPMPFVNACSRFLYLENLGQVVAAELPLVRVGEPGADGAARPVDARKGPGVAEPAEAVGASQAAGKTATKAATKAATKTAAKPATKTARKTAAEKPPVVSPATVDLLLPLEAAPLKQDTAALRQDARLVALLRNAVESAAGEDGWSALSAVGQQITNQASFDPRNHGYRKLIDLIEATQLFDLDRRGSHFVLRDKRLARPVRS